MPLQHRRRLAPSVLTAVALTLCGHCGASPGSFLPAQHLGTTDAAARDVPLGTLAPSLQVGYFAARAGGIDALDLDDGTLLWHTDEAYWPLIALEGALLAASLVQGVENEISIVALDASDGAVIFSSSRVVFPDWVRTRVTQPCCTGGLKLGQARLHDADLVFAWSASLSCVSGISQSSKQAGGEATVDLGEGEVRLETVDGADPVIPVWADPSSPVLAGPRGYRVEALHDPGADPGDGLVVIVVTDAVTGQELWRHPVHSPAPQPVCTAM